MSPGVTLIYKLCVYNTIKRMPLDSITKQIQSIPLKTSVKTLFVDRLVSIQCIHSSLAPNKHNFRKLKLIASNKPSFDISTCRIWYAIVLLKNKYYMSTLRIVNEVLRSIPPFALYASQLESSGTNAAKKLYLKKFLNSNFDQIQRAGKAWLFDFLFDRKEISPLAIQIEMYFCRDFYRYIFVPPFICLYYLMFQCYHELRQYDNRDRALSKLEDSANNVLQGNSFRYHSFNITGHCMVIAGQRNRARRMFLKSFFFTYICGEPNHSMNSAMWYMQHFC